MLLYIIPLLLVSKATSYLSCGSVDYPAKPSDCTSKSTSIRSCCYAEYNNGSPALCSDFQETRSGTFSEGGVNYTCPEVGFTPSITVALFCGPQNPVNLDMCSVYSNEFNSCCFLRYKGEPHCINLGRKFSTTIELDGDKIECSGSFFTMSKVIIAVLIFIFF
jgi:hypothetical protein